MIRDYLNLIRVRQWYKNLVVFLAIFFVGDLFRLSELYLVILAFFSLSFVSSVGYIINDLKDLEKDKLHPEKKLRALASGKVSVVKAIFLGFILFVTGFIIAYFINWTFLTLLLFFLIIGQIYTFLLKEIIFADVIAISMLFVARALAGAIAIDVYISPWLILCPFFLALFLAIGKRHGDLLLLKEKAECTREVLASYTLDLTNGLMVMSTTLLIISYTLYSFFSVHHNFMFSLPFALFVVFRYYFLIQSGSIITRHPEKVLKDRIMIGGIFLWGAVTFILMYFFP